MMTGARRIVKRVLLRIANSLYRRVESMEAREQQGNTTAQSEHATQTGGAPSHWLKLVRRYAPELLRPGPLVTPGNDRAHGYPSDSRQLPSQSHSESNTAQSSITRTDVNQQTTAKPLVSEQARSDAQTYKASASGAVRQPALNGSDVHKEVESRRLAKGLSRPASANETVGISAKHPSQVSMKGRLKIRRENRADEPLTQHRTLYKPTTTSLKEHQSKRRQVPVGVQKTAKLSTTTPSARQSHVRNGVADEKPQSMPEFIRMPDPGIGADRPKPSSVDPDMPGAASSRTPILAYRRDEQVLVQTQGLVYEQLVKRDENKLSQNTGQAHSPWPSLPGEGLAQADEQSPHWPQLDVSRRETVTGSEKEYRPHPVEQTRLRRLHEEQKGNLWNSV